MGLSGRPISPTSPRPSPPLGAEGERTTTRAALALDYLPVAVFAALPSVGLFAGPSYTALVFGLGLVQFLAAAVFGRPRPIDRGLLAFAVLFAALAWASLLWSTAPQASPHGALQVTAIFAASLITLAGPTPSPRALDLLFRTAGLAVAAGAAILAVDAATGFHLQALFAREAADIPAKYNRGADYLVLLAWPLLAAAVIRREQWMFSLVFIATALVLLLAPSATGRVAAVVGLAVLLLGLVSWRAALGLLAGLSAAIALGTPFLLHFLGEDRARIAARLLVTPHLRMSGLARLEIWDYMSTRAFERPLLGWGLWGAKSVPIAPQQVSHFVYAGLGGNYPHNQWLQLWLELGAIGAALALAFVLLVLRRIVRARSAGIRPFASAAFASAMTISLANYDVATDSWWAAIVACAWLFLALNPVDVDN